MGHNMSRYALHSSRSDARVSGQVPFTPLWQPRRLLLRVRRHGIFTLEQPAVSFASVRLRAPKRMFRSTFSKL